MEKQTVGERIRFFRMSVLGMNQKDFAAKLGIAASSLNRIENGLRRPDNTTYMVLAQRTVISMDWLFLGDGPMRRAHHEPDPVDWAILNEGIERICRFAGDHKVEPAQAVRAPVARAHARGSQYARRPAV